MPHVPAKPAKRSKEENKELVGKHLAQLSAYERDIIYSRVLYTVDNGNCDDALRDHLISK
jgi:hypothetical protein